jgi:hypothetical protein
MAAGSSIRSTLVQFLRSGTGGLEEGGRGTPNFKGCRRFFEYIRGKEGVRINPWTEGKRESGENGFGAAAEARSRERGKSGQATARSLGSRLQTPRDLGTRES